MTQLEIRNNCQGGITLIDNGFIDRYMAEANGEYVKAYLLLLRHSSVGGSLSVAKIADCLECTERDVMRALGYWEKIGLIGLTYDVDHKLCGIEIARLDDSFPSQMSDENGDEALGAPVSDMRSYKNRKDFAELSYVAECYLGKPLSKTESDTISYFLDELALPVELIEYLIEYSVEGGHKSFRYMKAIARAWSEKGITSIEEAKADADEHSAFASKCNRILKAYGISGRSAADSERDYIRSWLDQYHFPMEVILEACGRTVSSTQRPSFAHTNKILTDWHGRGVKTLADVGRIDPKRTGVSAKTAKKKAASFNNAPSRDYDMDDLEKKLLQSN